MESTPKYRGFLGNKDCRCYLRCGGEAFTVQHSPEVVRL